MIVRCNICEVDLDESEIENHVTSIEHQSSKKTISIVKNEEYENKKSVVQTWQESTRFY